MLNETEAAASFHGLCHFFGRLSKASRAGMKAALRGCPKCHFPMLEGLAHTISTRGQNGTVYVSDFAREAHQPLPAISRSLRRFKHLVQLQCSLRNGTCVFNMDLPFLQLGRQGSVFCPEPVLALLERQNDLD
jgi:hypothetical protein